jgi:hypothetical protein
VQLVSSMYFFLKKLSSYFTSYTFFKKRETGNQLFSRNVFDMSYTFSKEMCNSRHVAPFLKKYVLANILYELHFS